MKELFEVFTLFFKIGCVSFGGGYAMLPILQKELTEKRNWVTEQELIDFYALGQCTPGVIAVNVATLTGYKRKKVLGGIVGTLGVILPSMIIITIIAAMLHNFADIPAVKDAFAGIRACVCVLILNAIIKLWKKSVPDSIALIIFLIILCLSIFTSISAVFLVLGAGIAGIVIYRIRKEKQK